MGPNLFLSCLGHYPVNRLSLSVLTIPSGANSTFLMKNYYHQFSLLLILFVFVFPAIVLGQNNSTEQRNALTHQLSRSPLNWLSPALDTNALIRVKRVTFSSKSSNSEISAMYNQLADEARNLQCNGFVLNEYLPSDVNGNAFMTFTLFNVTDSILGLNDSLKEKGRLYVLGSQRSGDGLVKFRVDGKKTYVKEGLLKLIELIPGMEHSISKGGLFGMTIYLRLHSSEISRVISLGGMSVGSGGMQPAQIGISISTGSLSKVDSELGLLLIQVLQKE